MATTKWVLDPTHSEILFKVKHLMITNVKGEFRSFSGEIDGEDFSRSKATISIDASSVFTNNEDRDKHLVSPDFFDTEKFDRITFESVAFQKVDGENYKLTGILTMKGVSKEITLDVEFGGTNKDPWGNEKAGFSVSGTINRKDWGLNWNAALETGGVLVGEDVKIMAEVQFVKQPS
ncbi:MAG: YceI family protein [Bacteroidota bacterium]